MKERKVKKAIQQCNKKNIFYQSIFKLGKAFLLSNSDSEWKEIKQTVTWKEAVEVYTKGQRVRVESDCDSCRGHITTFEHDDLSKDTHADEIASLEITTGKWYILD